jgi:hypothetical protein
MTLNALFNVLTLKGFIMFAQVFMLIMAISLMVFGLTNGRLLDMGLGCLLAIGTLIRLYCLYKGKDIDLWGNIINRFNQGKTPN